MGFSLPAFLAAMDDGFSFDFTKTDRHFQENTGPTLADSTGEAIGLALESREWNGRTLAEEVAVASEVVSNGEFPSDLTGWTLTLNGGTITWTSAGVVTLTRSGINARLEQAVSVTAGKTYRFRSRALLTVGTGNMVCVLRLTQGGTAADVHIHNSTETLETYYLATSTGTMWISAERQTTDGSGEVYEISLKEVPTHHGVQSSASLKGTRQVFYGYSDDQPELVTNGGFDAWTDPTVPDGWAKVGTHNGTNYVEQSPTGSLHLVSDGTYVGISQDGLEIGKVYSVSVNVSEVSDASGAFLLGLGTDVVVSAAGVYNRTIVATGTTIEIKRNASAGAVDMRVASISVKEVPASRITTGCKYDGSDDNHLTTYYANSGANFIVAYVNVPTTISSTQIIAGASIASADRAYLAITTGGILRGAVGSGSTLDGTTDLRGKSVVVGISFDGTSVDLFVDRELEATFSQSGVPTQVYPMRIGAGNLNGGASAFFSGTIEQIIAGPEYLDLATFLKIRNKLIDP